MLVKLIHLEHNLLISLNIPILEKNKIQLAKNVSKTNFNQELCLRCLKKYHNMEMIFNNKLISDFRSLFFRSYKSLHIISPILI